MRRAPSRSSASRKPSSRRAQSSQDARPAQGLPARRGERGRCVGRMAGPTLRHEQGWVAVQRLVIRADWTIVHMNGRQVPVEGLVIVVEDGRIVDLTREPPTEGETIAIPGGIAFPGFINL